MKKALSLGVFLIALAAIGAYVYVNTPKEGKTVSVEGYSEVLASPDFVSVYAVIETLNISAEDSKNTNAEIYSKVLSRLKEIGIEERDIESSQYSIYEDYSWTGYERKFNGWKTVHGLKISVKEYDKVGKIIDAVVDNRGLINYISFELTPETQSQFKAKVIESATKDAKTKAEAIARGSGKKLGSLVSVNMNEYYYLPYRSFEATSMDYSVNSYQAKQAATQISPSNLKISARVQAVYKIV